ncbi:hypothetical protein FACS1894200_13320 [Spirochaetia bacterium]|nr:hypothetical protein FACS1894200_13320 [Spirochaetia bacterium]
MRDIIYLIVIFPVGILCAQSAESNNELWTGTVPAGIRQPQFSGSIALYPKDVVIGELGKGEAPNEAYDAARKFLTALVKGANTATEGSLNEKAFAALLEKIEPLGAAKYRIGGGQTEADGEVSFLVRLVGRTQWISGELYLTLAEEQLGVWHIDDFVLEPIRDISTTNTQYPYEFSPYERFF